jgi:mannosyltransferase OCH1-like enzyme
MIPKTIHYCWFGGDPLPEFARKYIDGWKKHCPDYKLMLWNESNFDINKVPFTAQVASVKKWGFIVDYVRAYAVYNYGGIYLDVDVELLRPFDNGMLQNKCIGGFENEKFVAPGLIFAGEKESVIAKEVMDFYSSYNFIKEGGELNLTASPKIFTDILLKYGLKQKNVYQNIGEFTAYPTEFFCPKDFATGKINVTGNTYSIHHYDASWVPHAYAVAHKRRRKIFSLLGNNIFSKTIVFCDLLFVMVYNFFHRFFVKMGPMATLKYYWKKTTQKNIGATRFAERGVRRVR